MDITSGGTPGPRLADHLADLDNNVYGHVPRAPTTKALAELFVQAGWSARKSSWTTYEVEHEWARIDLFDSSPTDRTFSGVIDPPRLQDLATALEALGLRYSIELWSPDRTTLLQQLGTRDD